jgi:hydroxypyruvate reductase
LPELEALRRDARAIYERVLASMDARRAVLDAVELRGHSLRVCAEEFDLGESAGGLYCVALGKAAGAMASALDERLGARLDGGVLTGPPHAAGLSERWRVFAGGHPLPNEESLAAARAAFELLGEADRRRAVVIFLVSGGGSAMLEWPRDSSVTLADLREANRVLVACGANIAEVNAVRRALSAVKGGGLAARAPLAAQLTLIVSDTADGREADVASGPTLPAADEPPYKEVVRKYDLARALPPRVAAALKELDGERGLWPDACDGRRFVLLDNARAREEAAGAARAMGFVAEVAGDLSEQAVEWGAAESVARLRALGRREGGRGVCLVSGGEFACPVRGPGVGGRNSETALRCAFEFEKPDGGKEMSGDGGAANTGALNMVALCAGTDGVDGNSPAAGAISDHTTLARARARGLRPEQFLADSDAHTFFDALGDAIVTGPTGTNVRDLRILLAAGGSETLMTRG